MTFQSGANTIVEFNTAGPATADMQVQLNTFTARVAASGAPPRYSLAASVSGACIYCHFSPLPGERIENPPDRDERLGT